MYGTDIGVSATIVIDPKTPNFPSGLDTAPIPVGVRAEGLAAAASWDNPQGQAAGVGALGTAMAADGFRLQSAEVTGNTMRVRYENTQYRAEAQGVGRVSRILTQAAPANVSYDAALISDAAGPAPAVGWDDPTPAFLWGIAPYVELSLFDGDKPVRADAGIEATFQYELRPNVVIAGAFRQRLAGNRNEVGAISESGLPDVRRTGGRYGAESGNGIENLFISWYGRPGRDLYSRASLGYFERGFAGASGELLWKPVDSRLALGAELNYTLMRDFDLGFGFRPECTDRACTVLAADDYDVVTGHV